VGTGENHTRRPASAAASAATRSLPLSAPLIRTELQCRSSAMIRSSHRTTSGSKRSRVLCPPGAKPVS
jgi:hypothetical protein